jgi:hypothetical protein
MRVVCFVIENVLSEALTCTQSFPRQPESFIGQVRRDSKPYPADPNWHDCALKNDLPSSEEASAMKDSDESENRRDDKGKGPLGHVDLREEKSCTS